MADAEWDDRRWYNRELAQLQRDQEADERRKPLAPCGTLAACRRHYDHGEPPCLPCRMAAAERDAERRERNRRKVRAA